MEGFSDVPAYLVFKSLMRCIEGLMMGFTERERESKRVRENQLGKARQRECMCTFHCSAEQKIITDGAPSSRDFPTAAMDREGWRKCASENREGGNGMNPGACMVRKKKEHWMRE